MNFFIYFIIYLYANIPFTLYIGLLAGKDIRLEGSGNVGGTNLGRVCGKKYFLYSFFLDGSKGFIACTLAQRFELSFILAFILVIIGHGFSFLIKFKGGKGVASSFGFAVAFAPLIALVAIIVFLITLKISKFVSLSSMTAILTCAILLFAKSPTHGTIGIIAFVLSVVLHKKNISRILNGEENKVTWI